MNRDTALLITMEARRRYPNEICGMILDNGNRIAIRNVHPIPHHFFEMDPAEQLSVQTHYGNRVIGVYHSHPHGETRPSRHDLEFPYPGLRYWIATLTDVYEWRISDGTATPVDPATGNAGQPNLAYPILAAPRRVR